jgi:hypothetical protein
MNIHKIKKPDKIEKNYLKKLINIGKRIYKLNPSDQVKEGIINVYNKLNEL